MRRLARQAFTALSALSLLLCVAVCVLWVRYHNVFDVFYVSSWDKTGTVWTSWNFGADFRGLHCSRYGGVYPPSPGRDVQPDRGWFRPRTSKHPKALLSFFRPITRWPASGSTPARSTIPIATAPPRRQ